MKLSFCAIVKDEEASLARCLSSVKDLVDEMVVLDTGSSDRTPEIASSFGAKVYHFEWNNDFSAARNESLKYVQGEWVLVLDADEVLVPEISPQIKQAITSDEHILINLIRHEIGAAQSPYSLVSRLFRNHPKIRFSRPYHAMVDDSVQALLQEESQWQIGYLQDVALLHYGYQPDAIASGNKLKKAKRVMEGFLATNPYDPYVCSKLGALYVEIGDINHGVELLQRGLNRTTTISQLSENILPTPEAKGAINEVDAMVLYELHYHLGNAYTRMQNFTQATTHYQAAIEQPILPKLKLGAYNNFGNILIASGDLTTAKTAYETTLQIEPTFATGYYNLGMTLKAMGLLHEAIEAYQKAINLNPNYAEAYQNLGVALLKFGKVLESLSAFRQAIALHEQNNPDEADRLRQGLLEMGFQI